jgi:hypothetical protein
VGCGIVVPGAPNCDMDGDGTTGDWDSAGAEWCSVVGSEDGEVVIIVVESLASHAAIATDASNDVVFDDSVVGSGDGELLHP